MWVLAQLSAAQAPDSANISAQCQEAADAWCNFDSCAEAVRARNESLPLFARLTKTVSSNELLWRCCSPSSLSSDLTRYTSGPAFCTRDSQIRAIISDCERPDPNRVFINASLVFTAVETQECGLIRTPSIVQTTSALLLFAQCRNSPDGKVDSSVGLKDDFRKCRQVMKRSLDSGKTWGAMRFLSPIGTGVGAAVYDIYRKTIVLQYQKMPFSNPYKNNTLLQITSKDDGWTWSAARDLTRMLDSCYGGSSGRDLPSNMVCGGAGSRIQLHSGPRAGRILFNGHNGLDGGICVWYSDDGGETYNTTVGLIPGNEASMAQLSDGSLYMNGRAISPWKGNRTSYTSIDAGATWSDPSACALSDVFCEAALVAVDRNNGASTAASTASTAANTATTAANGTSSIPTETRMGARAGSGSSSGRSSGRSSGSSDASSSTLFLSEPHSSGRTDFRIYCSCDGGHEWEQYIEVNTGQNAEYSDLQPLADGRLLAVWEIEQCATQVSYVFNTSWCSC